MFFQERHDGRHVDGDENAEADAEHGAECAEGKPLGEEDAADLSPRHAHGAQNGDVAPFFGNNHVHGREQAEGGDHDDEAEDDEHGVFLGLHGAEVGGVVEAPVAGIDAGRQLRIEGVAHQGRLHRVMQHDVVTGNTVG